MGRPRAFDWDEAARLYAELGDYTAVGVRLGVTCQSVRHALRPELRARAADYQRERRPWVGACIDCGRPATKTFNYAHRRGRCADCNGNLQTTSARPDTLKCVACGLWLPDDQFAYQRDSTKARRQRRSYCKPCEAVVRRDYRTANPDHVRAVDREAKRRRRAVKRAQGGV